jgi:flavin reductase (DIM6/NTAB) family NADH-FMN oxidoreductase RutF
MREPVALPRAARLLNHGATTLITTRHQNRQNVMAAAWVMPLDFDPPKLCAVVAQGTHTRALMDASGVCGVQLPTLAQLALVNAVGHESGADVDKFARHGVSFFDGHHVDVPLVEGCAAWLECRVVKEPHMASAYDLFVLEVVAAHAERDVWDGRAWAFGADDARRTVHHGGGRTFFVTGATHTAPE